MSTSVVVRFAREGGEVDLDPGREYRVSVDGDPWGVFRSPWSQQQLEELIASLRNVAEEKADIEWMRRIGKELGAAIHRIDGLPAKLATGATVYWQLDYPELARIPWELATADQPPYHHLLLQNVSFVRRIPAAVPEPPARWPTGRNETLRLLFAWSERPDQTVPHEEHREQIERICSDYDVEVVHEALPDVRALAKLCGSRSFHFVHLLAHGARVDGEWGLRLANEVAKGEQIARALVAGGTTPALVTVSACDSASEPNHSFGSVAYYLHVHGIPLVLASQFRLRKALSTSSVAHVYEELLGGGDPLGILVALRRQLAPADNEAWANEVLYSRYRHESLQELSTLARQQAALRRARCIARERSLPREVAIAALEKESVKLRDLVRTLESVAPRERDREAIAETCGLLGSLRRRIAELRSDPPDLEELRQARSFYERGLRADANSHYCAINVVHLSLRVGDQTRADEFMPHVRFAATNNAGTDFWAYATLGDLEVLAGRPDEAAESYRSFAEAVEEDSMDARVRRDNLESSRRPLAAIGSIFPEVEFPDLHRAKEAALAVLDAAIKRNSAS